MKQGGLLETMFEECQINYVLDVATERYKSGDTTYRYSTGICGLVTAGYGLLDEYGYFEYPLKVNQGDYSIEGVKL